MQGRNSTGIYATHEGTLYRFYSEFIVKHARTTRHTGTLYFLHV